MSRYYKVSRILLWLLLIFLFANQLNAAKWWDVYFTEGTPSLQTNTEFEQNIKNIIETAKYSLYIASYTWGTGIGNDVVSVANALFQKGLDVKLVGDGSNEFNPAFNNKIPRNDDGSASGEMHNKLIIIDANKPTARVITGSTNWTEGAYSAQYNNSLVLYVPEVANEYAKEFTELFNGTFHGGALGRNQFTAPDGSRIELYFSPEDNPIVNKMVPAIRRAKKSVFMLANNLTRFAAGGSSDAIGDALIAAKNNGVVVEIVVDPDYYNSTFGSTKEVIDKLISRGIDCRILPNPTNQQSRQHNKIVIIDNELVITGSANFTKAASDLNDENQIYIHSPALAREYLRFFRKLMAESPARVSSPTFEQEPPSAVRNVIGNPTSDGIKLTWSQSNVSDFNRYYIYISKSPIVDVSNLRPEIANITDRKITEYTVKTFDSGSPLEKEQTYYLAVTVADLHGNESKVTATNGIYYTGAITGPYPLGSISFEENASQKTRDNSVLVLNLINGAAAGASISKIELDFGGSDSSFRLQLSQPKNGNWEYSHTTDKITYQGGIITAGDTAVFRIAVDNPVLMGLSNSIKLTATGVNSETREITLNGLNITPSDLTVEASISVKTGYSRFASEQTILQLTLKNTSKDTNEIKEIAIFGRNNNDEKTYNKIQLLSALEQPTNLNWIARDLTVLPDLSQIYFDARRGGSGLKNGQQDIIDFSAVLPTKLPKADNILVYILSSSGDTRLINVPFISDISYGDSVIIINEFMYNPAGQYDRYFEFIELYNKSDLPFDISGWSIDCDGIVTVFPEGTVIAEKSYLVIASVLEPIDGNNMSFANIYGNADGKWEPKVDGFVVIPASSPFDMSNISGYILLKNKTGSYISKVEYNINIEEWRGGDGTGSSMEKVDQNIYDVGNAYYDGYNYQASYPIGNLGSPGGQNNISLSGIQGFSVVKTTDKSVTLKWSALSGVSKFETYKIYYSTSAPVTTDAAYWDKNNDTMLASIKTSQTTITGLTSNTKYYFAIVPVINGIEQPIVQRYQISAVTVLEQDISGDVYVLGVSDGDKEINVFDGSEFLKHSALVVRFKTALSYTETEKSEIFVIYDVNKMPDPSNQQKRIPISGVYNVFQAVIPSWDPDIRQNVTINFVIEIKGKLYYNNGNSWSFKILGVPISVKYTNVSAVNINKNEVLIKWQPEQDVQNFKQYRIYYAKNNDTITYNSNYWSGGNDLNLYYSMTNSTIIKGLDSNTVYKFKVVAENIYGYISPLVTAEEVSITTAQTGSLLITEVYPALNDASAPWVELYCYDGSVNLANYTLTNLKTITTLTNITLNQGDYYKIDLPQNYFESDDCIFLDLDNDSTNINFVSGIVWADNNGAFNQFKKRAIYNVGTAVWDKSFYYYNALDNVAEIYSVIIDTLISDYSIARKMNNNSYNIANNRNSWEIHTVPSPLSRNQLADVLMTMMTDGGNIATDFLKENSMRDTDVEIYFQLTEYPRNADNIRVYYALNRIPTVSDNAIAPSLIGSDTRYWKAVIPKINSASINDTIVYIAVLVDGKLFYNNAYAPRCYRIDNQPPVFGRDFYVISQMPSSITLYWSRAVASDFAEYVIYYDTQPNITAASNKWDKTKDSALSNIATQYTKITNLQENTKYYFAYKLVDALGNETNLSDTVSGFSPSNIYVRSMRLNNNNESIITNFNEIQSIGDSIVIEFILNKTNLTSAPKIFFLRDNIGLNNISYTAIAGSAGIWYVNINDLTLLGYDHNDRIRFVLEVDGCSVYRTFNNDYWEFILDIENNYKISNIRAERLSDSSTTIHLFWQPVAGMPDFAEYLICYSEGDYLDFNNLQYWNYEKNSMLKNINTSISEVRGLKPLTNYTFAVITIDNSGNYSELSDTVLISTNNQTPAEDPATDGINIAVKLDGSERLQLRDIIITTEFENPVPADYKVYLWYDANKRPDGPALENLTDKKIEMTAIDGIIRKEWAATIPSTDEKLFNNAVIEYVFEINGLIYSNRGASFKFVIDNEPPYLPKDFVVLDYANRAYLFWSNTLTNSDFKTYKIRYSKDFYNSQIYTLTKPENSLLGLQQNNVIIISNLDTLSNYYFELSAIDIANNESAKKTVKLTRRQPSAPEYLQNLSENAIFSSSGSVNINAIVRDANGIAIENIRARFEILSGASVFANGYKTIELMSDIYGKLTTELFALNYSGEHIIKISLIDYPQISTIVKVKSVPEINRDGIILTAVVPQIITINDTINIQALCEIMNNNEYFNILDNLGIKDQINLEIKTLTNVKIFSKTAEINSQGIAYFEIPKLSSGEYMAVLQYKEKSVFYSFKVLNNLRLRVDLSDTVIFVNNFAKFKVYYDRDSDTVAYNEYLKVIVNAESSDSRILNFDYISDTNNYLYLMSLGTNTLDFYDKRGNVIRKNIIALLDNTAAVKYAAKNTILQIPANVLPVNSYIEILEERENPQVFSAVKNAISNSNISVLPNSLRRFSVKRINDNNKLNIVFSQFINVGIKYNDNNNDGIEDNANVNIEELKLYRYDEQLKKWQVVADGGMNTFDNENKLIAADLKHFSYYAIGYAAPNNSDIYAYPNPYNSKIHNTNKIIFNDLSGNIELTIYNVVGRRVYTKFFNAPSEPVEWNLKNTKGEDVSSGIYIYKITHPKGITKGKIGVIR